MAAVKELIRIDDRALSFGDYELAEKAKLSDFPFEGDMYKVKTYKDITKLERNGMFVYESVPGTSVFGLTQDKDNIEFTVEGPEDAQITVEMEADTEYEIILDGAGTGRVRTNLGGKLSFNAELENASAVHVQIKKC